MLRLAADCDKQDFRPTYVLGASLASPTIAESEYMDGAAAAIGTAPWFVDSEQITTMREAMAEYQPDQPIDATVVSGWVAGVVLGQAIENALEANGGEDVTSADILTGLGMIEDETFGGLTPPLTFTADGVQAPSNCYFGMTVVGGEWTAENGGEPICPTGASLEAIESLSN
jgi:branched-chain amino acid transport system substrate-binding protein